MKVFILHHILAPERKMKLQEDLAKVNLQYPIEWVEKFLPNEIPDNRYNIKKSELSLSLKHQYVFEQIIQCNMPYGIVFEDDVDLLSVPNISAFIEKSIKELKDNSGDVTWIGDVWVGKYTVPEMHRKQNQLSHFSDDYWSRCTHAYIISNFGAQAMLEDYNHDTPIDHLFNNIKRQRSLRFGWTTPGILQKTAEGVWSSLI